MGKSYVIRLHVGCLFESIGGKSCHFQVIVRHAKVVLNERVSGLKSGGDSELTDRFGVSPLPQIDRAAIVVRLKHIGAHARRNSETIQRLIEVAN